MTTRLVLSSGDHVYVDSTIDRVLDLLDAPASSRVLLGSRVVMPAAVVMVDELPAPSTVTVERIAADELEVSS